MASEKSNFKRKPWIAGLLSFMLAGLGQLYNGQLVKGIIYFILAQLILFPPLVFMTKKGIVSLKIIFYVLLLSVILEVVMFIDAVAVAKRLKIYSLKWFNRWYNYLGIIVILSVPFLILPNSDIFPQSYKVPSESMEPQLLVGDYFFATQKTDVIKRGDIVVFRIGDDKKTYVKRVIGLPGDHVEVTNSGEVILNGTPLLREGAMSVPPSYNPSKPSTLFLEHLDLAHYLIAHDQNNEHHFTYNNDVPEGHLFVMGDHRTSSMDSRIFGPIDIKKIDGIAQVIYFSLSPTYKIRWNRIGLILSNMSPK